jgi:hypothetical protein
LLLGKAHARGYGRGFRRALRAAVSVPRLRRGSLAGRRAAGAAPAHEPAVQALALAHRTGGRRSRFGLQGTGVGRMAGAIAGGGLKINRPRVITP